MALDAMEALADWTNLRRTESGAMVRTSCILPSGTLLNVSVRPAMDGWMACDEGAVVADALAHGFEVESSLGGLAKKLSRIGLRVEKGKIYSKPASSAELPFVVAHLATESIDASRWLMKNASRNPGKGVATELEELIDRRYADRKLTEPFSVTGDSSKRYRFRNVLILPDRRRLILDPVRRHDGSINSRLVANLDVRRANHEGLEQRIVYDGSEGWERQELALLGAGAETINLPRVEEIVDKMAA